MRPDESTLFMLEDQPLEVTKHVSFQIICETTSISTHLKSQGKISWLCHKNIKSASISNFLTSWGRVFCRDSKQIKNVDRTGHKQHTVGNTDSHGSQMQPSSYRETSSVLPLMLLYVELWYYFIVYFNITVYIVFQYNFYKCNV